MDRPLIERVKHRIREHGQNNKISQLCMDELPIETFTPEVIKQIQKCKNIEYVSFQKCNIKSGTKLPILNKLETLDFGFNQLTGSDLSTIAQNYKKTLITLNLQNNHIQKIEQLAALQQMKQLTRLIVTNNPLCSEPNYKIKIFQILPQVENVDGFNENGNTVKQETSQSAESQDSESDIEMSEDEQQRDSPTKKRRVS